MHRRCHKSQVHINLALNVRTLRLQAAYLQWGMIILITYFLLSATLYIDYQLIQLDLSCSSQIHNTLPIFLLSTQIPAHYLWPTEYSYTWGTGSRSSIVRRPVPLYHRHPPSSYRNARMGENIPKTVLLRLLQRDDTVLPLYVQVSDRVPRNFRWKCLWLLPRAILLLEHRPLGHRLPHHRHAALQTADHPLSIVRSGLLYCHAVDCGIVPAHCKSHFTPRHVLINPLSLALFLCFPLLPSRPRPFSMDYNWRLTWLISPTSTPRWTKNTINKWHPTPGVRCYLGDAQGPSSPSFWWCTSSWRWTNCSTSRWRVSSYQCVDCV